MDTKKLSVEDTTGIDATEGLIASVSQGSQPSVDVRVVVEDALERGKELMGVTYTSAMNYTVGSRDASRPIKHRPTFTEDQISTMEAIFKQRQYLSPAERENVANAIGLTAQQVRVWFQNRRQKVKQFLSVKQHRSGNEGTNSLKNDGIGNIQIDISSLLAQAQKSTSQIDPQMLQLLLPKTPTTDQNGSEEESGETEGVESGINTEKKDNDSAIGKGESISSPVDASSTSTLGIVTSNGTITLNPQTLLYLTPLLLPLNMQQQGGASSQTSTVTQEGVTSNNPIPPINAVQLLQTLSAVTSRFQNTPQTLSTSQSHSQSPKIPNLTPLRAQSPVPVEDTVNASSNSATVDVPSGISSDVFQQIFGQSTASDKTKTTWTLTTTPPASSVALTLNSEGRSSPRKKRQVFSGYQISEMEKRFEKSHYIDTKEREVLAKEIGLQADQVKVWFQNRRTKKTRLSWRQKNEGETGGN